MSSGNCEYVRRHYGVPACIGRQVIAYGKPGVITTDFGHYIGIVLDEDRKRVPGRYHPTDGIVYGGMEDKLPKPPKRTNFDDFNDGEWNCTFSEFLEINQPQFQLRFEDKLVRMVRYRRGTFYSRWPERDRKVAYRPDEDVEVAGEWMTTKGEAKASYKQALADYRAKARENREVV